MTQHENIIKVGYDNQGEVIITSERTNNTYYLMNNTTYIKGLKTDMVSIFHYDAELESLEFVDYFSKLESEPIEDYIPLINNFVCDYECVE